MEGGGGARGVMLAHGLLLYYRFAPGFALYKLLCGSVSHYAQVRS